MINAGKYKHKIKILKEVSEENADGYLEKTDKIVYSCRAQVKTTKGYTLIKSGSDFESAYTNFTIRYPKKTKITRDMRILFKGKKYTIEYLNDIDDENVELEIQAKQVTK